MTKYNKVYWVIVLAITLSYLFAMSTTAQTVIRKGNVLYEQPAKKKGSESIRTTYTYVDSDGNKYPVMKSKNGKYYVEKVSKKSGKKYRKYIKL